MKKKQTEGPKIESRVAKILHEICNNPRKEGYNNNLTAIQNMKNDGVWKLLADDESKHYFSQLSKIYKVKRPDFYDFNKNLKKDINWLPLHEKKAELSRVFTSKQFHVIEELIRQLCDSHNIPVTNILIREVIRYYYNHLMYTPQPNLKFNCSNEYVLKVKEILNYSTRAIHGTRRPTASEDSILLFKKRCKYIFSHAQDSHIMNSDESFFRTNQYNEETWAKTGSTDVNLNTNSNDKEGFTFLATMSYDGSVYPLIWISKGTTQLCKKN
mgnify:CR=1 FL=1